jgi:hypothetical protein
VLALFPYFDTQGAILFEKDKNYHDGLLNDGVHRNCLRVKSKPYRHFLRIDYRPTPESSLLAGCYHLADAFELGLVETSAGSIKKRAHSTF